MPTPPPPPPISRGKKPLYQLDGRVGESQSQCETHRALHMLVIAPTCPVSVPRSGRCNTTPAIYISAYQVSYPSLPSLQPLNCSLQTFALIISSQQDRSYSYQLYRVGNKSQPAHTSRTQNHLSLYSIAQRSAQYHVQWQYGDSSRAVGKAGSSS